MGSRRSARGSRLSGEPCGAGGGTVSRYELPAEARDPEALERAFYAAADEGDTRGIESALILMAQIDPVRARKLYDDLRFVLEVEEMVDGMAMGGTDDA